MGDSCGPTTHDHITIKEVLDDVTQNDTLLNISQYLPDEFPFHSSTDFRLITWTTKF